MNSPVSCLPEPIQNMRRKIKTKVKKKVVARRPRPPMDAPAAYGTTTGKQELFPLVSGMGSNMIVQNYELVRAVTAGNNAFVIGGDVLNPGLSNNYPWLYTIAKNFSKFRWRALRYIYVPSCSTATAGSQFLYYSYDYLDNQAASTTQVMSTDGACLGNAWFGQPVNDDTAFKPNLSNAENINVDLDVSKLTQDWYYVRTGNNANQPVTLTGAPTGGIGTLAVQNIYDSASRPAIIYYGGEGTTGTANIGYLFVSYVCEFCEPISASLNS